MPASDTFPSVIHLFCVKLDPKWFSWCHIFSRKRWNTRTAGLELQETRQLIGGHPGLLPVCRTVGCFASGAGCSSVHLFRNVFFWEEGWTRTTDYQAERCAPEGKREKNVHLWMEGSGLWVSAEEKRHPEEGPHCCSCCHSSQQPHSYGPHHLIKGVPLDNQLMASYREWDPTLALEEDNDGQQILNPAWS